MAPRRTIQSLIALTIPEIQEVFLTAMQDVVDRAMLGEMVAAIEANNAEALFRATGFTPAALGPILDRIERAYREAAEMTVDGFPARIRTPTGSVIFRFDLRNPVVERDLRENSSRLVTALTEEARSNVRTSLQLGMIAGRNPRSTALDIIGRVDPTTKKRIGGVIGLTENQTRWVESARVKLTTADESYFEMGLRDKRFDSTIRKYMDEGKPVPAETLQKALTSYKNRALKFRGDMIGRTETLQSINKGQYGAYQQAIAEGAIKAEDVTKWWDSSGDMRTRTTHRLLEQETRRNPIPLTQPFTSPSGAMMLHPGDTTLGAPAKEIINCRCVVNYEVDWLKKYDK